MPVTLRIASDRLFKFWSSSCWRVTTDTDCGISLSVCVPLPSVTALLVYESVPSLVAGVAAPMTVTASSCVTPPCGAACKA
ncbi:hypothetical protein D3C72_2348020 [compost metagenome]